MELRKAEPNEAEGCYQCIEDARDYHQSLGFEQWRPDYPTQQTILEDISQNIGYTFVHEKELIGYCCIMIGDEPAYQTMKAHGKRIVPMPWSTAWPSIKRRGAEGSPRPLLT